MHLKRAFCNKTLQILTTYEASFAEDKNFNREINFKIAHVASLLFIRHMIKQTCQVREKALGYFIL